MPMRKAIYFHAAKAFEGVLGVTPCRFQAGRTYEVELSVHANDVALEANLRNLMKDGTLVECMAEEAQPKLQEQLQAAQAKAALARKPGGVAGVKGKAAATVKTR